MAELTGIRICSIEDLQPGERRLVKIDKSEIAVFNVNGELYAIRNKCPHQGAPLVQGSVTGTMLPSDPHQFEYGRHNELIRCPLHGWEFDLQSGQSVFDPCGYKIKAYEVRNEKGSIVLYVNKKPENVMLVQ